MAEPLLTGDFELPDDVPEDRKGLLALYRRLDAYLPDEFAVGGVQFERQRRRFPDVGAPYAAEHTVRYQDAEWAVFTHLIVDLGVMSTARLYLEPAPEGFEKEAHRVAGRLLAALKRRAHGREFLALCKLRQAVAYAAEYRKGNEWLPHWVVARRALRELHVARIADPQARQVAQGLVDDWDGSAADLVAAAHAVLT